MRNGRILVLLSSYNGEKFIETQIRSILNQTVADRITLRIRDDGSSDDTVNVIERLSEEYENKIELIKGDNIGYNASFYSLINSADGFDYYALSDQDDVWLPSKLEYAVKALEKESSANRTIPFLYASTSYLVHDDLKPYGQTRRKQRPFTIFNTAIQNICPGHTQVMNQALMDVIQDDDIDTERLYVYDSWIINHAVMYGKILFNNSSFTYYRQHKSNQLGSGVGKVGQLLASIKRNDTGDGHKYRGQVEYLVERNGDRLREIGAYNELNTFIKSKTFIDKAKYLTHSKLYRQNRAETIVFDLAVLSGNY